MKEFIAYIKTVLNHEKQQEYNLFPNILYYNRMQLVYFCGPT